MGTRVLPLIRAEVVEVSNDPPPTTTTTTALRLGEADMQVPKARLLQQPQAHQHSVEAVANPAMCSRIAEIKIIQTLIPILN